MVCHGNNFGAEAGPGQSQQLVHDLRDVGCAAVAKPWSALACPSNSSGVLYATWPQANSPCKCQVGSPACPSTPGAAGIRLR